jgi:signal transduction histidine kinase
MREWVSSIAVRQAIASTIVVLLAVLGFALAALVGAERDARADLARTIDTDIAGLVDIMVQGGGQELQRRIVDRTDVQNSAGPEAFYQLSDPSGARLAGNLSARPMSGGATSAMLDVDNPTNGRLLVRTTRLRGGFTLTVGRSLGPLTASIAGLRWRFAWLAMIAATWSMIVGSLAARRLSQRLARINDTFADFDRGVPKKPTKARGKTDEIDRLSDHVDHHLARIERLLHAQREITDNIAHELRTPLVHLDGRLLRALDLNTADEVDAVLRQSRSDIRSIVALFDALLDIAMADGNANADRGTPIDLSELVASIGDLYSASAEEAGLDFSTRIAPGMTIRGEAMQLTRMIANLLDNAFKYVPSGARVRLLLAEGPTIIVEDNGPGVADAQRGTIFQRFRRGSGTESGHGLGLALVSVIAARHGLIARVEDAAPGARFIVSSKEPG